MQQRVLTQEKILVLRFSSFGDVVQTLSVIEALKVGFPGAAIHWTTRSEFVPLIQTHPSLHRAWGLKKNLGLSGLWQLAQQLDKESFTRIYDAHNNLRSRFLCAFLWWRSFLAARPRPLILRRSIRRFRRFLLFRLRINTFEQPFSGQRDLLEPLKSWGITPKPPPAPQLFLQEPNLETMTARLRPLGDYIALAPSAAFPLKRWPLEHWKSLLQLWLTHDPSKQFALLGGPEDHFLQELVALAPDRISNLAGQLSLEESAVAVGLSQLLISNDTGLLHVGEQLGHATLALMGPAPFGFPCRRESTTILELDLDCRPCSKHGQGPCRNTRYQWCLAGILPETVFEKALERLELTSSQIKTEPRDQAPHQILPQPTQTPTPTPTKSPKPPPQ